MVEINKPKSRISFWAAILPIVFVFICGYLVMQFICANSIETQSASEATKKSPPASTSSNIAMVTLIDGATLYGTVHELNLVGYLTLNNAYYLAAAVATPSEELGNKATDNNLAAGENTLKRFGEEAHSPNPYVVVPLSAVLYREQLSLDSPVHEAIAANEKANRAQISKPSLVGKPFGAVFLRTGEVYFGKISLCENSVTVDESYFLRFKDETKQSVESITNLSDVELVPRSSTPSGPTGQMDISATSVLYVQTLANTSPVVAAIKLEK